LRRRLSVSDHVFGDRRFGVSAVNDMNNLG
jgi:hypothetical protein